MFFMKKPNTLKMFNKKCWWQIHKITQTRWKYSQV